VCDRQEGLGLGGGRSPQHASFTPFPNPLNPRTTQAGFLCLYNFYAWPLSHRPRVAQVLVLPPLQGGGYGKALVAAAYHLARERYAIDLTVSRRSRSCCCCVLGAVPTS
jgi:GNAT superfamily N-acetyltransferase